MEFDLKTFWRELVTSRDGQAHALSIAVQAEEGDEGAIFDQLAERVEDPRLNRLVRRHRDDEVRHAELFRGCLARLGLDLRPIPDELKVVRRLAEQLGGFNVALDSMGDDAIAGVFALLLAVEERGVEVFPVIADAFETVDRQTAETYRSVTRDEMRHTKYSRTIGRAHAANDDAWKELVSATKMLEAAAFAEVQAANESYCISQGLLNVDRHAARQRAR